MELVREFNKINKNNVAIAGGKGASLGEMTQVKIPVPNGFVVLSSAFNEFIKETDLNIEIDGILDKVNTESVHTVDEASEQIKSLIMNTEMSKEIEKEILTYFKKLDSKFVAVRSSATSEDSASAAWAGQLDTYLNTTEEDLLDNVKKCWASLFTPRAIFYRFEQKLEKSKISVAVVVQEMVESEESGIAFSVHPITQDKNHIIIEAGLGLGEAIVSGKITPDSYVVDKKDLHIIDINVNEQSKGLFKAKEGGNEWKELRDKGNKQVLSKKEIVELSKLIIKIENHYGFPVDIEWAKEKGKFHITQSRPITTLKDKKEQIDLDIGIYQDYTRLFQGSAMPYLISNIFMDYYKNLNGLSVSVDNVWTTFLPNEIVKKTLKDGLKLYGNKKSFIKYKKDFENYKKECVNFFKVANNKKEILKEDAERVLELTTKNFFYYSKTEFFYLDEAYENSKKDKMTKENLEQFDKIKNTGREHLNKIFFGEGSLLPDFLAKLNKQFSVEVNDLMMYNKKEILDLFNGKKVSEDILNGRKKSYFMQTRNNELIMVDGAEAEKVAKEFIESGEEKKEILKGIIANNGKMKGKVKVIDFGYDKFHLYEKMIEEMDKGDVLVAETTAPELMAACKKAGAILTNQGGQMSHAAIVSRELGIPCLVGMGNITDILKDGDYVEVDANKGFVKIIDEKNTK